MPRILALFLAFAANLAAADKIVGGPFTVNVTTRSATVVWIVESDQLILHPPGGVEGRYSHCAREFAPRSLPLQSCCLIP